MSKRAPRAEKPEEVLSYLCDHNRHLICLPYSAETMKRLGKELALPRRCLSKVEGKQFWRIPLERLEEIMSRCELVPARRILALITSTA